MRRKWSLRLPVVFDTDCISSFLWIKRLDIVKNLFPNQIIIPQTVFNELNKMKDPQNRFLFNDLNVQILQNNFKLKDLKIKNSLLSISDITSTALS